MTPIQQAFKEYRQRIGKAPEDPKWVPDVNSVTFKHFEAGWNAKPHQYYKEVDVSGLRMALLENEDADLL